ncbi:hypothetical protein PoB_005065100 [Plakobranchus ocellatus]|uniref:C-type lectin domain-containing protein n=1 Tax=Plakobranchus ocellatus TaxID=259542 RepID=A0AAV4BLG6_9GAST|nr:hypothetical protein PoB_005065100 [Plakobranchus ocellatus]
MYSDGTWNDITCNVKLPYICRVEQIFATTVKPDSTTQNDGDGDGDNYNIDDTSGGDGDHATGSFDSDDEHKPADSDDDHNPADSDDDYKPADYDDDNKPTDYDDDNNESRGDLGDPDDEKENDGNTKMKGHTSQALQKNESDGLSAGAVAGIVICVLVVCVAVTGAALYVTRNRLPLWRLESLLRGKANNGSVGFDNNLYRVEQAEGQTNSGAVDIGGF